MMFDPTKDLLYKSRSAHVDEACMPDAAAAEIAETPRIGWMDDEQDATPRCETPQQQHERMRIAYNAALKRRISSGSIGSECITWTPTLPNRDRQFELAGRQTIVAALRQASFDELEMLERFIGNAEAMSDLLQHGKLPAGLKDHWRHPIRGGGRPVVENVSIMTVEAQTALRDIRIYPAIHHAYGGEWPGIKIFNDRRGNSNASRIVQLENYASSCLADPKVRRIEIGYPTQTVMLSDADFDLRDSLLALNQQAEIAGRANQSNDRDSRANYRPAAPHARQARSQFRRQRGGPR